MAEKLIYKIDLFCLLLVIIFGVITTLTTYEGFGFSNHIEQLPSIIRNLDNKFILNDFFTNASSKSIVRRFYVNFISRLSNSEENLPPIFLVLTFLTNISISIITFFFGKNFFNSFRAGLISSALVMSINTFSLGGTTSYLYSTYLVPSSIALPFILLGIYFTSTKRPILGITLSGISSLIHPLYGIEIGAILLLAYIFSIVAKSREFKIEQCKTIIISGIILVLFALPPFLSQIREESIETTLFIFILAHFRHPHHYIPSTFPLGDYANTLSFLIVITIIWIRRYHIKEKFFENFILILMLFIFLLCIGGYFFVEIFPSRIWVTAQTFRLLEVVKWIGLILIAGVITDNRTKNPTKMLYLASVFNPILLATTFITESLSNFLEKKKSCIHKTITHCSILLLILLISRSSLEPYQFLSVFLFFVYFIFILALINLSRKIFIIAMIALISFITLAGVFHNKLSYISNNQTFSFIDENLISNNLSHNIRSELSPEGLDIVNYAQKNTSVNSVFLTPPNWGQFRLIAKRAIVVDFKAFLFSDKEMLEWYDRIIDCYGYPTNYGFSMIPELIENYKKITDKKLKVLTKKYNIGYAVLYQETDSDFDVIYQNKSFKLIEIKSK